MKKNQSLVWKRRISKMTKLLHITKLTIFLLVVSLGSAFGNKTNSQRELKSNNDYVVVSEGIDVSLDAEQQKRITGKVIDNTGQALPGVTVVIKGSATGTVTNIDGEYSLSEIPDGATLVFSFVGMLTHEVEVGSQTTINVTMQVDAIGLEEVVAIGYGSVKRSNLTSSVSKMTDEGISERPLASVGEAFQGQLAGVRAQASSGMPGEELSIRIRGVNTITGDSNPLYIIDGIPRDNMSDINPSDIASIQILKDAASTSIYGARGGNGVVLIETKRGTGTTKPIITFESYYGISQAERKMENMNGPEFVAYQSYLRNLSYLRSGGSMSDPMTDRPLGQRIPDFWYTTTEFTDWQDEVLQNAPIQNYNLSAAAKGDIGNIYFSAGYLDQDGILVYTGYKRFNSRLNASMNISKDFQVGVNVSTSTATRSGQTGNSKDRALHSAINASPLMRTDQGTEAWGRPTSNEIGSNPYNPVETQRQTYDDRRYQSVLSSFWGEYEILKGLTFKSQYSYSFDGYDREYFRPYDISKRAPRGQVYYNKDTEWTWQNTFTYDRDFGDHNINVLAGTSASEKKGFDIRTYATGYPYETLYTLNLASTPVDANSWKRSYNTASYFGRVSYDYKEKYLLTASLRRDGSSRFGPNKKWGMFPSVTTGWKMSEEAFMEGADWVSLLKPRVSWGMAGNDRIGDYRYESLLSLPATSWNDQLVLGVAPGNIANPDLQWETTTTLNVGLDFTGFNNRVQLNVDYYHNKTEDLLFNVNIPTTNGFGSILKNLGSIENRGWEIDLTTFNVSNPDFKWTTNLNLSRNRNKILSMGDLTELVVTGSYGAAYINIVGQPVSQFYYLESNGILGPDDFDAQGNPLVPIRAGAEEGNVKYVNHDDSDQVINSSDRIPQGNNLPDLIFGMTNRFSYKGFDLSVLLNGQVGGKILWLGARGFDGNWGNQNVLKHWLQSYKVDFEAKYGQGENPIPTEYIEKYGIDMSWDGKTPKPVGSYTAEDDRMIYDTSFLRVKNVTLSYTMPKTILTNTPLKSVRLYVSVDNLMTFSDYPGFNPESNTYGNSNTKAGTDYITVPLNRRIIGGVAVTF